MNTQSKPSSPRRTLLIWGVIALYTLILPSAILVYRRLESAIGQQATGRIPLYSVLILGVAYVSFGYARNKTLLHLLYLIPAGVIAAIIIRAEPNPNKHIHIPEYILMAWLLYAALSRGYEGEGLYLLIFVSGSLLGVVDELEQGLHPRRFYGWSDMAVNSASVLIGIATILGLLQRPTSQKRWLPQLKRYRSLLVLIAFGFAGALLTGIRLFDVQALEGFQGVYPSWLLAWNALFVILTPIALYQRKKSRPTPSVPQGQTTARLWVYPILGILLVIHAIVLYAAIAGISFR